MGCIVGTVNDTGVVGATNAFNGVATHGTVKGSSVNTANDTGIVVRVNATITLTPSLYKWPEQ